nr:MAG TPA: hypothetical protein [Caudoviricetes sp.]
MVILVIVNLPLSTLHSIPLDSQVQKKVSLSTVVLYVKGVLPLHACTSNVN